MKFLFPLVALVIVSCVSAPQERYSHLETGMTKQQVIALLGPPKATVSTGALITMEFDIPQQQPAVLHAAQSSRSSCYVIIGRDERVRSFGRN